MSKQKPKLPIPKQVFQGLNALIQIGEKGVRWLGDSQSSQKLDLSFGQLIEKLHATLNCDEMLIQRAIVDALVPLNGLRRSLEIETVEFLASLDQVVQSQSLEWKAANLDGWNVIKPLLTPLFTPNNFFSQASKAFELMSLRPAVFQHTRVISELRPIYDEATTSTLALLHTNTLIVRYWDGENERVIHLTMDSSDIQSLLDELERAKVKIAVTQSEADEQGSHVVTYGQFKS